MKSILNRIITDNLKIGKTKNNLKTIETTEDEFYFYPNKGFSRTLFLTKYSTHEGIIQNGTLFNVYNVPPHEEKICKVYKIEMPVGIYDEYYLDIAANKVYFKEGNFAITDNNSFIEVNNTFLDFEFNRCGNSLWDIYRQEYDSEIDSVHFMNNCNVSSSPYIPVEERVGVMGWDSVNFNVDGSPHVYWEAESIREFSLPSGATQFGFNYFISGFDDSFTGMVSPASITINIEILDASTNSVLQTIGFTKTIDTANQEYSSYSENLNSNVTSFSGNLKIRIKMDATQYGSGGYYSVYTVSLLTAIYFMDSSSNKIAMETPQGGVVRVLLEALADRTIMSIEDIIQNNDQKSLASSYWRYDPKQRIKMAFSVYEDGRYAYDYDTANGQWVNRFYGNITKSTLLSYGSTIDEIRGVELPAEIRHADHAYVFMGIPDNLSFYAIDYSYEVMSIKFNTKFYNNAIDITEYFDIYDYRDHVAFKALTDLPDFVYKFVVYSYKKKTPNL